MTKITAVGYDHGNTHCKGYIEIDGKVKTVSIPNGYSFDEPSGEISAEGRELKAKTFPMTFTRDGKDWVLWFGQDVLGDISIQKIGGQKYNPDYLSVMFRATMFAWSAKHKIPLKELEELGRLDIVASMPPGSYQKHPLNKKAHQAYTDTFNGNPRHKSALMWVRSPGKKSAQINTNFVALTQECALWGETAPRKAEKDEFVLVIDLGGGTTDLAIYNGSKVPIRVFTDKVGLLHTFSRMNPGNPAAAMLETLRHKKSLPKPVISYFDKIESKVQLSVTDRLPVQKIYIIGGGAALMKGNKPVTDSFMTLAPTVIIKDEFANAEANWGKANETIQA